MIERLKNGVIGWLNREAVSKGFRLHDFEAICSHLQMADVVLVEGRTRVSGVVQAVTLSNWSHAALYVGRVDELPHQRLRERLRGEGGWSDEAQIVLEAELGRGAILSDLRKYRDHHVRICRPQDLLAVDARRLVRHALEQLGTPYDVRQIFDLLRFFFPYGLLPRRWRSTLFGYRSGRHARTVCSTLIARSFARVRFPILPVIQRDTSGRFYFVRRNSRLVVPRDFDNSPYFEIIKYPFLGGYDVDLYRQMHWDNEGVALDERNYRALASGKRERAGGAGHD